MITPEEGDTILGDGQVDVLSMPFLIPVMMYKLDWISKVMVFLQAPTTPLSSVPSPHTGRHNTEEITPLEEQRSGIVLRRFPDLKSVDLPSQVLDLIVELTAGNALLADGEELQVLRIHPSECSTHLSSSPPCHSSS
jgi:hypothetical protein